MTLTPDDRQELIGIVGEAIAQVVMPHIVEIKDELKEIHGRMDGIDGRLDHIEGRLDSIEQKLDATIASTDRLDVRVTRVEQHVGLAPAGGR